MQGGNAGTGLGGGAGGGGVGRIHIYSRNAASIDSDAVITPAAQ
jgi:hypothetical protein